MSRVEFKIEFNIIDTPDEEIKLDIISSCYMKDYTEDDIIYTPISSYYMERKLGWVRSEYYGVDSNPLSYDLTILKVFDKI